MRTRRVKRWLWRGSIAATAFLALLWIPDRYPPVPAGVSGEPFVWGNDGLWEELERRFVQQAAGCPDPQRPRALDASISELGADSPAPDDPRWAAVERDFFELAVAYAACPERFEEFAQLRRRLRIAAKDAAVGWDEHPGGRARLYRVLYGSRAAVEEVLLQLPPDVAPSTSAGRDVASSTPSTVIRGVRIHSGDLLLSRGGAPTSAFIARGSDYPGNFSHVALVHIDADGQGSVIESHIERGVIVASPEDYFRDKKLRILVLRLRPDHAALSADPLLPHRAATRAREETLSRHIPYDFAMDFEDPEARFCSEVASNAYGAEGIALWPRLSAFSSPGLARWMAGFGVERLETHGPSDLEYDPSLQVVAEWHDPETLLQDHIDNAVIDALLERAEDGLALEHDAALLPLARVLKAYSVLLNRFGGVGPIPEGMSATVALRARWLENTHARLAGRVRAEAKQYEAQRGYRPPYWDLVQLARAAGLDLR